LWRDVVGAEVDSIGSDCQRNVGTGIDEKSSSQFSVLSSQLRDDGDGITS
jgi:hypothetical protein